MQARKRERQKGPILPPQVLPNLENAVIAIEKLRDYVLNPDHPNGRHKARVFKSMLGIERRHAGALVELIKDTLIRAFARKTEDSVYGSRWESIHEIIGLDGQPAIVTVAWLFRLEQPEVPVLITCFIDTKRQEELRKLLAAE